MRSLNSRVLVAAGVVLAAFLGSAGWVLDQAFRDSALTSVKDRLQGQIFMLLGRVDLDVPSNVAVGSVLPDAALSTPDSGHYAQILDASGQPVWKSRSLVGLSIQRPPERTRGKFVFDKLTSSTHTELYSLSYTIVWEGSGDSESAVYTVQVCENAHAYWDQVKGFRRSLWLWFAGIGVVLLLVQTAILRWGLKPLRDVAGEVRQIEEGVRSELSSGYPAELSALTTNLNALIRHSQSSVQRYRNALGDLAHSLKTPLAVLRITLDTKRETDELAAIFTEQIEQLDARIQYQLQRAAAVGGQTFGRPVAVKEVAEKIATSLRKVYAGRSIHIVLDIEDDAKFFGDRGDLMEILGNIADNACKWARTRIDIVAAHIKQDARSLRPPLRVRITDDGGGMPADKIRAVLERGMRLDQTTEGQGIGLAVVRELVEEIYNGTVVIESGDGGTSVILTLSFS